MAPWKNRGGRRALCAIAIATALVLSACHDHGGGDDDETPVDEPLAVTPVARSSVSGVLSLETYNDDTSAGGQTSQSNHYTLVHEGANP